MRDSVVRPQPTFLAREGREQRAIIPAAANIQGHFVKMYNVTIFIVKGDSVGKGCVIIFLVKLMNWTVSGSSLDQSRRVLLSQILPIFSNWLCTPGRHREDEFFQWMPGSICIVYLTRVGHCVSNGEVQILCTFCLWNIAASFKTWCTAARRPPQASHQLISRQTPLNLFSKKIGII